jgi:hypothetical protein
LTVSLPKVPNEFPPVANIVQFSSWRIHGNENAFAGGCLLRRDRMVANEPALYPILTIFVSTLSIIQPKPFYLCYEQFAFLYLFLESQVSPPLSFADKATRAISKTQPLTTYLSLHLHVCQNIFHDV